MKKKIYLTFILTVSLFAFTGCYDAVFQSIRDEIELTTQEIPGFINNIARYNDGDDQYLFLTNGFIQYKNASVTEHGAWKGMEGNGLPQTVQYIFEDTDFKGVYFYKIIADSKCIYALGYKPEYDTNNSRNVPGEYKLYYTTSITKNEDGTLTAQWKENTFLGSVMQEYKSKLDSNDDDNYGMAVSIHLFGTNSINPSHRVAFLRIGGGSPYLKNAENKNSKLYKLDGDSTSETPVVKIENEVISAADEGDFCYSEASLYTLSVVWFNGKYHFMNFLNAETNEGTTDTSTSTVRTEPTYVYYGDEGYLYYFSVENYKNNAQEYTKIFNGTSSYADNTIGFNRKSAPGEVICIAVTTDSLVLGTGHNRSYDSSSDYGDGAAAVKIDSATGEPTGDVSDDELVENGDSQLVYPYTTRALITAEPSKTQTEASIYATMDYIYTATTAGTNTSARGLWAKYPNGKWNRE